MARPDKVAAVDEIRTRLERATATVLTEYRGLSVSELQELRARLRETDAEYKVVKNTLTRRAAAGAGLDVPDEVLVGPTAITFCAGDPVATAKVLRAFSREHPGLVIKGGILDGNLLGAEDTRRLADLASREELLAQIAVLLGTALAQPARLARANLDRVARVLGALRQKREQAGDAGAVEAAGPDAEPAEVAEDAQAAEASDSAESSTPA